ncbi:MAG TPA: glycosyltransferase [Actinomycetota bacterium]|nr:glycosyltransferase [Actinomycetota bacterium]
MKFVVAQALAAAWLGVSVWLSLPWLRELAAAITTVPAILVVSLIAYLPGWLVAFLALSLLLDRQPPVRGSHPAVPVTVLIAARNEAERIQETIARVAGQDYPGPIEVLVVDNGSTDGTRAVAEAFGAATGQPVRCISEPRPGKSHALNTGLPAVGTELVITLDADTLLHPQAVRQLVARLLSAPVDVQAVAGSVLVRNSRDNLWTRMQEWDYFLGMASVKRMQGLYQGTLVAQGAFSLYRTQAVLAAGGWPDAIGEDIVLTWQLMRQGGRVYYEPSAVAFTAAPARLVHLARQRARWARGMIEGIRSVKPWNQPRGLLRFLTAIDLLIPALDVAYALVWLPGLLLAVTGRYWIVGPYTLAVLPLTLVVNLILYRFQRRRVFNLLGLRVRRNAVGFVGFGLTYQMLMSPVAVVGYGQELLGLRRRWK